MYASAEYLIESGHAYVDSQSADEMRAQPRHADPAGRIRLSAPQPPRTWTSSAHARRRIRRRRARPARQDRHGSPNINLRDPAIYRIRHATHHNTGDAWCIYPMYTYAHPIEDALENITHSICTLEFEDQRPFYDWLLERLAEGGLLQRPLPQQIEFARLNLTYVVCPSAS
jgi:glutaminyl-tRNA synthetase